MDADVGSTRDQAHSYLDSDPDRSERTSGPGNLNSRAGISHANPNWNLWSRMPNANPEWFFGPYAATSTLIVRGFASSRNGNFTVSTPFLYSALTFVASTVFGSVNERLKVP